jgi:hypothetical protein
MALILESARFIKARWEISDQDFSRIWTFCALTVLVGAVYAFSANEGPADWRSLFQNPSYTAQRNAGAATARAAAAWIRCLPMFFFLFVAAQTFSTQEGIPLETISLILRMRWKRARRAGLPLPPRRSVDVSFPYFGVCLFAAGAHPSDTGGYFWGFCALTSWALWSLRPRRFSMIVWAGTLGTVIALAYFGQRSLGPLQHYLGSVNLQWFSGAAGRGADPIQSRTTLGRVGRLQLSGRIVVRLDPRGGSPPPLLREASYTMYKGLVWYSETQAKDFETILEQTNRGVWVLQNKTNSAQVNIACYLIGGNALLPLPTGSGRLEKLAAYLLQKNPLGSVLAQGPNLVIFDALYGPGTTIDCAFDAKRDLQIQPNEEPALAQIVSELGLSNQSPAEACRKLQQFFSARFSYTTYQAIGKQLGTNETILSRFLLHTRKGHCEYFATAATLLLREAGIPARYAVGFTVHEASGRKFVVRLRDAHAWCLVWDKATRTWADFDPTPASWVQAETARASRLEFLSDMWWRISFEFSKLRWGQTHLRQYLIWSLIPVMVILLYRIVFSRRQRQRTKSGNFGAALDWPGRDSDFYRIEQALAERGVPRQASEPLSEWLQRALASTSMGGVRDGLQSLLQLHYRYRFDPNGLGKGERERLQGETEKCLVDLERGFVQGR